MWRADRTSIESHLLFDRFNHAVALLYKRANHGQLTPSCLRPGSWKPRENTSNSLVKNPVICRLQYVRTLTIHHPPLLRRFTHAWTGSILNRVLILPMVLIKTSRHIPSFIMPTPSVRIATRLILPRPRRRHSTQNNLFFQVCFDSELFASVGWVRVFPEFLISRQISRLLTYSDPTPPHNPVSCHGVRIARLHRNIAIAL